MTEEFSDGHLSAFVADVYESKQMPTKLAEHLPNTFAKLLAECKLATDAIPTEVVLLLQCIFA